LLDPEVKSSEVKSSWSSNNFRVLSSLVILIAILVLVATLVWKIIYYPFSTAPITLNSLYIIAPLLALLIIVPYFVWVTFLGTKECNPNWYNNPFGMPRGSVRAIITLLFVITALVLGAAGEMTNNEWLIGILGTIIGFYFGERKEEGTSDT